MILAINEWMNGVDILGRLFFYVLLCIHKLNSNFPCKPGQLVHPQKVFLILMKFGIYVDVDDGWVMHSGLQYDQIQGQSQGHEPLKVGNCSIFKCH